MGFSVGKVVSSVTKTVSNAVGSVTKNVSKGISKAGNLGKNWYNSSARTLSGFGKGNISKGLLNMAGVATLGAINLSGRKQGLINLSVEKRIGQMMGSSSGAVSTVPGAAGLIQLRKGKGGLGGGSYSETAKYPLGGSSGLIGK